MEKDFIKITKQLPRQSLVKYQAHVILMLEKNSNLLAHIHGKYAIKCDPSRRCMAIVALVGIGEKKYILFFLFVMLAIIHEKCTERGIEFLFQNC